MGQGGDLEEAAALVVDLAREEPDKHAPEPACARPAPEERVSERRRGKVSKRGSDREERRGRERGKNLDKGLQAGLPAAGQAGRTIVAAGEKRGTERFGREQGHRGGTDLPGSAVRRRR